VVAWPAVPGASGYNLYVSASPANVLGGTKLAGVTSPYTQSGLALGDTRYYQLTAVIGGKEEIASGVTRGMAYHAAKVFPTFYAVVVKPGDTLNSLADHYLDDPEKGAVIADFNQIDELKVNQPLIIPRRTAVLGGLTPSAYQTIPVLAYNDFSRDQKNAGTVMLADFEQQMQFLHDKGYRVISLNAFMNFMNMKEAVPERAVVITVDIGWKSFYALAYPVLQRHHYPATLFVRSGEIGTNPLAMDWKQVRDISAGGIDIECNSHTQTGLDDAAGSPFDDYLKAIRAEITQHLEQMRKGAGVTCRHFAYPTGNASHLVVAMLQKYGIESGFTLRRGTNPFFFNNFRIRRLAVSGTYDLKRFELLLSTSSDQLLK
ncbi:MAG: polysaccharide deacetylase family protein, partial [Candidatus Lambdaproteobacteria bacterium]|nr:polysaccharide deacetylase family protein [Candidatus Lambdaproteobacteria bacterium]